ncbi:MAG TPA: sigma factor-like helix-turn-helix DNA-binding protein [Alphaproteobacteria bacterium]|nr:sigma factor-like helix-turn-helix DNA-binding protein [Alphaproteobacteria bacterium]
MANSLEGTVNRTAGYPLALDAGKVRYGKFYHQNSHRIYSRAFLMLDNEIAAEHLTANTFLRAFACSVLPTADHLDRAFLTELRELTMVGGLTLKCSASAGLKNVQNRTKRIYLERAVVQLPATEKLIFLLHDVEGYDHDRTARLLGMTVAESQLGLHQARLQIRELVGGMP